MMTPAGISALAFTLTLNDEERAQLVNVLEQALHDKEIENHRTDSITYRQHVQHEEALLRGLLDKLRQP